MTIVIGLLGPAGSGKGECAKYLVEHYGAKEYAFANPLKEILKHGLGFTDEQLWGATESKEAVDERYGYSPRWFMQHIGTEGVRRVFGPDIWWKTILDQIAEERPLIAVISDVRFVNEAKAVMRNPGYVWRVENPKNPSTADATHQSESEWKRCPYSLKLDVPEWGLDILHRAVEQAAAQCCLGKIR